MNSNSKMFAALLIGIAAGAGLGLLFAPEKGIETRDKLSGSLKSLGSSIKETAIAEFENLAGLKDKVVESLKTKANGTVPEYQDDLEHA
jgi:gas vesicle protein